MFGQNRERWRKLCEQIAEEEDPARFSELVKELLAELEAKDKRLKSAAQSRPQQEESHQSDRDDPRDPKNFPT